MQTLRRARSLARLVLAWLVLSLGVAAASPLVHPQSMQMVCSAAGMLKVVVLTDDGVAVELGRSGFDCPLCVAPAAPPSAWAPQLPDLPAAPRAAARQDDAPPAMRPWHVWQARAPPAFF